MIKRGIAVFAALVLVALGSAQKNSTTEPTWMESMQNPAANFYETQRLFYDYWSDKTPGKGDGYKPFKRWEWFYELEVDEDGNLPDYNGIQQSVRAFRRNSLSKDAGTASDSLWTIIGPVQKPVASSGQPNGMGRVNAIGVHPTNDSIIFAGTPNGGIWRSYDFGQTWKSNTDTLATMQISSIVFDPLNPQIVYAGTGDRDVTSRTQRGVIKSTDGGISWTISNAGMGNVVVGKMIIDPKHPDTLLAATSGGIYKSTNGAISWSRKGTGNNVKDIEACPVDFTRLYATGGGTMYYSHDNGETWTRSTGYGSGSRGAIAVSANRPNYVYFIQTSNRVFTGLYRSTNYGVTFSTQSTTPNIMDYDINGNGTGGQAWYNLDISANPNNAEEILVGGVNIFKSTNGGVSWSNAAHWLGAVHADQHVFEFTASGNYMIVGNDGGVYYTENVGRTWINISDGLPISEIYKIGQNKFNEEEVICGYQDNGTAIYRGNNSWTTEIGGDGMECAFDPVNSNYVYGELYYGAIRRSTNRGSSFRSITGSISEQGAWVSPFVLGEADPRIMYAGYVNVYRTNNVQQSNVQWQNITPTIAAGTGTTFRVIENSPADPNILYIVRSDNRFYRSDNCTAGSPTWVDITSNQPISGTTSDVEAHPLDPNIVYITKGSKVFVSTDKGLNWTDISQNLPSSTKRTIVYDEYSQGGLYVGGTPGVYYIDSNLTNWVDYSQTLPGDVSVTELEIAYNRNFPAQSKLRAATYGRGLWSAPLFDVDGRFTSLELTGDSGAFCIGDTLLLSAKSSKNAADYLWNIHPNSYQLVNGSALNDPEIELVLLTDAFYSVDLTVSNFFNRDSVIKRDYLYAGVSTVASCNTTTGSTSINGSGVFEVSANSQTFNSNGFDGTNSTLNASCEGVFILNPDSTYPISIKTGALVAEHIQVYIDYNDNGSFSDPGELVHTGSANTQLHNFSYTAPSTPILNEKLLMRVISDRQLITGSCGVLSHGNSIDYGVVFDQPEVFVSSNTSLLCPNEEVEFSYTNKGRVSSVKWDFRAGANPQYSTNFNAASTSYLWGGQKIISLTVNDNFVFYDTVQVRFSPYANLVVDSANSDLCEGGNAIIRLIDSSGATNPTYQWFQNDQPFSAQGDTLYNQRLFNRFITIDYKAVVSDSFCVDTSEVITVGAIEKPVPLMSLFNPQQCEDENTFLFEDKTTMYTSNFNRFWTLSDGTSSSNPTLNHQFADTGFYTVNLEIVADNGCRATVASSLRIHPNPNSSFSSAINGVDVSFTPQDTNWAIYSWDFGDGNQSTDKFPIHTYAPDQQYNVELKVESQENCSTTSQSEIGIEKELSTHELSKAGSVNVFPNPSDGNFNLAFPETGVHFVTLFNAMGAEIMHETVHVSGTETYSFQIVASGMYVLNVQGPSGRTIRQIVVE